MSQMQPSTETLGRTNSEAGETRLGTPQSSEAAITQVVDLRAPQQVAEVVGPDSHWTQLRLPSLPTVFVTVGQESQLPQRLQAFHERLDSNEFQVRDAAMREIAGDRSLQADLESVVFSARSQQLSPEVAFRLNAALRQMWENSPEFTRIGAILGTGEKAVKSEVLTSIRQGILEGIRSGNSELYEYSTQQVERTAAITEAFLAARTRLEEQYEGTTPFAGVGKRTYQPLDYVERRLEALVADPESASGEMFTQVEYLHDVTLEHHGVDPEDLAALPAEKYYSLIDDLRTLLTAEATCQYLKSVEGEQVKYPANILARCEGYQSSVIEPFHQALASGDHEALFEAAARVDRFANVIAMPSSYIDKSQFRTSSRQAEEGYQVLIRDGVAAYDELLATRRERANAGVTSGQAARLERIKP